MGTCLMSAWHRSGDQWAHRPWFKLAINTVLRALQTRERPARLFVMYTRCDERTRPPTVLGYGFGFVTHRE